MATRAHFDNRYGPLLATVARLGARVVGTGLALLVGAIAIGHGRLPNLLEAPPPVAIEFAALATMVAGSLIGWRNEQLGGWMVIAGWFTFASTELAVNGSLPGATILLFGVPGVLYLLSHTLRQIPYWKSRRSS